MKKHIWLAPLLAFASAWAQEAAPSAAAALPRAYLRSDMPHIDQRDRRIMAYHYDISALCGPTAGANALVWLARNGHEAIKYDNPFALVGDLARRSGTEDGGIGTNFRVLAEEMVSFLQEAGYPSRYEFMGSEWSKGGFIFTPIDWDRLKASLLDRNTFALVALDNCHYSPGRKIFYVSSGHLVTLAGYDDEKRQLIIADPNEGKALQRCPIAPVEPQDGTLVDDRYTLCDTKELQAISRSGSQTTDIVVAVAIFTLD